MRRFVSIAAMLAFAAPLAAQIGPPLSTPPPGVVEGDGAAHPKGGYAALDALPDWGGIWFVVAERPSPDAASPSVPTLKGEYLADYEAWREQAIANHGVVARARSNCSPPGLPRIMQLAQYPYEFLFTPGRVTINQEAWMQTRTIWTDGRQHPPVEELDASFHGHSVGHWEGDALVIETVGIDDTLEFGTNGMQHSAQFVLRERIYLHSGNPDLLVNEMRMEDPLALEEPFEVTTRYRRDRYGVLIEFQCAENDRNPIDEDGMTLFE